MVDGWWFVVDKVGVEPENESKWIKPDQIGSNWIKVGQSGSKWTKMNQNGPKWIKMDQTCISWIFYLPEDCDDNVCCTVVLDTFVDRIGVIC